MDNVLKPLPDDKQQEPEKPKKPVKNFIQKNREKIVRGKKGKDDDKNGTVTLTQDQLNAILASVGKVASGEEDKLKISFGKSWGRIYWFCSITGSLDTDWSVEEKKKEFLKDFLAVYYLLSI